MTTLGVLLQDARTCVADPPSVAAAAGLVIVVAVPALNFVGGTHDAADHYTR